MAKQTGAFKFSGPYLTEFSKHYLDYVIVGAVSKYAGVRAVRYIREEIDRLGINDTRALRDSFKSEVYFTPLGPTYRVWSDEAMTGHKPVAMWVNDGTGIEGPHSAPIVPTTRSFMAFNPGKGGGGATVYAKSVRGQKATHFLDRAIARIRIRPFI